MGGAHTRPGRVDGIALMHLQGSREVAEEGPRLAQGGTSVQLDPERLRHSGGCRLDGHGHRQSGRDPGRDYACSDSHDPSPSSFYS